MDIATVVTAVWRRWYVSVVVMGLTAVVGYQLWQDAAPEYTSSTTVAVVPSTQLMQARAMADAGESSLGNPFGVQASGVLAGLLADSISNGEIVIPPAARGTQVAVELNLQRPESFFTVVAVGPTPDGPVLALSALAEQSPQVLANIQAATGAPSDQMYTAVPTRAVQPPSTDYPDRQRAVLGAALAGLLVAALLSVLVDSALRRRRQVRSRKRSAAAASTVRSRRSEAPPVTPPAPRPEKPLAGQEVRLPVDVEDAAGPPGRSGRRAAPSTVR